MDSVVNTWLKRSSGKIYVISCVTSVAVTLDKTSQSGPFRLLTSHYSISDKDRSLRPAKDRSHFVVLKNEIPL